MARSSRALAVGAWLTAALVALPVLSVALNLTSPRSEVWRHLADTILWELLANTFWLLLGVGALAGLMGTVSAWLVATRRFPGRDVFEWALVLPLAVPTYVIGFVFVALFEYAGPVPTFFRETLDIDWRFPNVRSYGGVVLAMSLVVYPYVYLLALTAFRELGANLTEVARSLGCRPAAVFRRVGLPLARPAIATGVALALMETLADFGTVSVFGYRTLTTAIYRVWFGMFDRVAAGQLAVVLMLFALMLVTLEQWARGRMRFVQAHGRNVARTLPPLTGVRGWAATAFVSGVLAAGFLVPTGVLAFWSLRAAEASLLPRNFPELLRNTLALAASACLLAVAAATVLAYAARSTRSRALSFGTRVASLGYAIPGSVIAVGVLLTLVRIDGIINAALGWFGDFGVGLILTGSALGLLFAYLVRFISVAFFSVESGLTRISGNMDESARGLGAGPARVLGRVHLPLLRGSLLTALILVFVDVMKEMPATMLIRPFGVDTLAVEVWQRTAESMWTEASAPALSIVAAGILPVIVLTRLRGANEARL